jgi:hypothetical protein
MTLTYADAATLLATARNPADGKPLANNTRLVQRGDDYAVRLHNTDVVTIHPDGTYTLRTGGWETVTTKDRINRFSPARVYSERGTWGVYSRGNGYYIRDGERLVGMWEDGATWVVEHPIRLATFRDGMTVDGTGRPIGVDVDADAARDAAREEVDRLVTKYIRGFVAAVTAGEVGNPGPGDCFGCYLLPKGSDAGTPRADALGADHYLLHMREGYYVPSLLWRALQRRGDPAFCWQLFVARKDGSAVRGDLRAYLGKIKPALVDLVLAEAQVS